MRGANRISATGATWRPGRGVVVVLARRLRESGGELARGVSLEFGTGGGQSDPSGETVLPGMIFEGREGRGCRPQH